MNTIQLYVMKFVSDLRQVAIILWYYACRFSNHHNIVEILLRVVIPIKSTKACELDFRLRPKIGYPVEALWFPCSKRLLSRLSVQSFDYDEGDSRINVLLMTNNHYVHVHCLVISHLIILLYMSSDFNPFDISYTPV